MWDVAVAIATGVMGVWGVDAARPLSGIPFLVSALALAWHAQILPQECYTHGRVDAIAVAMLLICTDGMQCLLHAFTHWGWLGTKVRFAHAVHHASTRPQPRDAFVTGPLDALVQLMVPLFGSLHLVCPNRTTAIAFGVLYSQWLVYLHSGCSEALVPSILVSPSHHRQHHRDPSSHFAHIVAWDRVWSKL